MVDVGYQTDGLRAAQGVGGSIGDYFALMKPRVMSLVVFTALVGMVLAPDPMHPALAAIALICIAVGAGASGALNMWYDADIDACMQRTANRPIPCGYIAPEEALTFGTVLAIGSVATLGLIVNWVAALAWPNANRAAAPHRAPIKRFMSFPPMLAASICSSLKHMLTTSATNCQWFARMATRSVCKTVRRHCICSV